MQLKPITNERLSSWGVDQRPSPLRSQGERFSPLVTSVNSKDQINFGSTRKYLRHDENSKNSLEFSSLSNSSSSGSILGPDGLWTPSYGY